MRQYTGGCITCFCCFGFCVSALPSLSVSHLYTQRLMLLGALFFFAFTLLSRSRLFSRFTLHGSVPNSIFF
jgi:hypothetical protein